jgi:hypothetical protein
VLLLATIAASAAFCLAGVTSSHLNLAMRHRNAQDAVYLAEAVVSRALSEIHANPQWAGTVDYQPEGEGLKVYPVSHPTAPTAARRASLSFVSADASVRGLRPSQTTLHKGSDDVTSGRAVLDATAWSNGVAVTVEVVVEVPTLQYVIGSAAKIEADSVRVDARESGMTADVVSNFGDVGANTAGIRVGEGSFISGDLVCHGAVDVPADVRLNCHRVRSGAEFADLPDIRPTQTMNSDAMLLVKVGSGELAPDTIVPSPDGLLFGKKANEIDPSETAPLELTGANFCRGSLSVPSVTLTNAYLYVEGSLQADTIEGNGALYVGGNTTLKGAHMQASANGIALFSKGDFDIEYNGGSFDPMDATPPDNAFFSGLVYTRGNFTAKNVLIQGTFVMAPPEPAAGERQDYVSSAAQTMRLSNVHAVYDSNSGTFKADVKEPSVSLESNVIDHGQALDIPTTGDYSDTLPESMRPEVEKIRQGSRQAAAQALEGKPYSLSEWVPPDHSFQFTPGNLGLSDKAAYGLNFPSIRITARDLKNKLKDGPGYKPGTTNGELENVLNQVDGSGPQAIPGDTVLELTFRVARKDSGQYASEHLNVADSGDKLYVSGTDTYKIDTMALVRANGHSDPVIPGSAQPWINVDSNMLNAMAPYLFPGYSTPNLVDDMARAAIAAQVNVCNWVNNYGVPQSTLVFGNDLSISLDFSFNHFLGDKYPLRVISWRTR